MVHQPANPHLFDAEVILRKTFESMGDAVVFVDRRTRTIVRVNPAFERIFGYAAGDVIGKNTRFLYHDEEIYLRSGQESAAAFAQGLPYRGAFPMLRADGRIFDTEHSLSPIYDDDGVLVAAVSVVQDRTEWNQVKDALAEREQMLSSIADNLPGAIYTRLLHPDGRVEFPLFRGRLVRVLGLEEGQPASKILHSVHPHDRKMIQAVIEHSARTLAPIDVDVRRIDKHGNTIWTRLLSQPYRLNDGTVRWDGLVIDVTARHLAEEKLVHLSNFDQVTGLANRRLFSERLSAAMTPPGRWHQCRMVVVALNIDRFKYINTTYGTAQGDFLLATVAQRLQAIYPGLAEVARLSGDEFALAFGVTAKDAKFARDLRCIAAVFETPFALGNDEVIVTASIGIAVGPDDGSDADTLLRNAGTAMHRSRTQGGGQSTFYSAGMSERMTVNLQLERQLRRAIAEEEFVLHYQPQVNPLTGAVVGLEALVRWQHPERGLVYPDGFIGVAENCGLIQALDNQVLTQACRQCRAWLDAGLAMVPVSVNVSPKDLDGSLYTRLATHIQTFQIDPAWIQLEVTEGLLIEDPDGALRLFTQLRGLGVRLVLDDFGTGYSSLGYLRHFPFDKLKIDRAFVEDVVVNPEQACLVKAIIDMARGLRMETVVEGVETQPQLKMLVEMGCDIVQGWVYSKAVDANAATALLRAGYLHTPTV